MLCSVAKNGRRILFKDFFPQLFLQFGFCFKFCSCKPVSKPIFFSQIMVTNVTSLLKTVKSVEDEHTRGTRALEATIEAIAQEIRVSASVFVVKLLNCVSHLAIINIFLFFYLCRLSIPPIYQRESM